MCKYLLPLLINSALFTFDDGPSLKNTPKILRILKKHNIKAVFCIPAINLHNPKKLKLVKRILNDGHTLCNHSYSHPVFSKIPKNKQWWEIVHSQKLFKRKLGIQPKYFRPPCGVITPTQRYTIKKFNMKMLMWNIDSRDWMKKTSKQAIIRRVIRRWKYRAKRNKRSIILFHDTNGKTANVLETVICKIKGK